MKKLLPWLALTIIMLAGLTQSFEVHAKENEDKLATLISHIKNDDQQLNKDNIENIVSKIPKLTNEASIEKLIEIEEKNNMTDKEIAELVIKGEYGNGEFRKQLLEEEGRDFDTIQKEVKSILPDPVEVESILPDPVVEKEVSSKPSVQNNVKNESSEAIKGSSGGQTRTMQATAYSTRQPELSRYTADGTDLHVNPRVVAVDPNVIPLGTKVSIEGYGIYVAADTGGAIKGNRIDIHFETVEESLSFGRRDVNVTIHK